MVDHNCILEISRTFVRLRQKEDMFLTSESLFLVISIPPSENT
jgi:hypothetical protein